MAADGQAPSDDPVTTLTTAVSGDPEVHKLSVGFIRLLYGSLAADLQSADRRGRMEMYRTFLMPILRDAFARRGGKSDEMAALATQAEVIRDMIGSVLPDDDH